MNSKTILLLTLLLCLVGRAFAGTADSSTKVPDYDYSQTRLMVYYQEWRHVFLGDPFEHPTAMGAKVYKIILPYVAQFQDILIPSLEPTHTLDLLMKDINYRYRLGQRLYVGDAWLSDGKIIALMKHEDYRQLANLLDRRFASGESYDSERAAILRRPRQDELPQDWLPEDGSVTIAINRMRLNEYGYPENSAHIKMKEQIIGVNAHAYDAEPVAQQNPAGSAQQEPNLAADLFADESSGGVPLQEISRGTIPHQLENAENEQPVPSNNNLWRLLLAIGAMAALLLVVGKVTFTRL